MPKTSNCAFRSVPTSERPDTAGGRRLWTGYARHVTGREWRRMWKPLSTTASTAWIPEVEIPRPLAETTHGTDLNSCLHFDDLYIDTGIEKVQPLAQGRAGGRYRVGDQQNDSERGLRNGGNQGSKTTPPDDDDTKFILVLKEDITGFAMLEPASAANADNATVGLRRWLTTLGVPSVLVSDTATHYDNHLLAKLTTRLGMDHHFAVTSSPWINDTVQNVTKEVLNVSKALLIEYRSAVTDWEHFVSMVQWTLNSSYRARLGGSPYEAWFGREPTTLLASLVRDQQDVVDFVLLTNDNVRSMVEPWPLLSISCANA